MGNQQKIKTINQNLLMYTKITAALAALAFTASASDSQFVHDSDFDGVATQALITTDRN